MRIFKRKYKGKDGKLKETKNYYIELKDQGGRNRRFSAFADESESELLGRQIERLVNYFVAGEQPDVQLAKFLKNMSPKLRQQLIDCGLIDQRQAAMGKPLTDHVRDFLNTTLSRGADYRTAMQYSTALRQWMEGCKILKWSDISASRTQDFWAGRRAGVHGLSIKTTNGYLRTIKQFCKWMVQDGRASDSPLLYLSYTKFTDNDRRRVRRSLEIDEVRRLLQATRKSPVRYGMSGPERSLLYQLAIETGLRRSELMSLTKSSFDFESNTVTIEAQYAKNRRTAILPMKKATVDLTRTHLASKLPAARAFDADDWMRSAEMLRVDLADADIPYADIDGRVVDFHSLRHTCGSLLAASGVHPKMAQQIMRHSDINLTMGVYTHTLRGQESAAIEKMPDFTTGVEEKKDHA